MFNLLHRRRCSAACRSCKQCADTNTRCTSLKTGTLKFILNSLWLVLAGVSDITPRSEAATALYTPRCKEHVSRRAASTAKPRIPPSVATQSGSVDMRAFLIDPSAKPYPVFHPLSPTCCNVAARSSTDGKLGEGVTYELQYCSRTGQDWILVPTKMPNKILTGLSPDELYFFRVRAVNSAGWGDFSAVTEFQMPRARDKGGAPVVEATD